MRHSYVPLPAQVEPGRFGYFELYSRAHLATVLANEWSFWVTKGGKKGWVIVTPFTLSTDQRKALARAALRFGSWCDIHGPSVPVGKGHRCIVHENCKLSCCAICDDGMLICEVCRGAEATLPSECPGKPMTFEQCEGVARGEVDFRKDGWVDLQRCSFCAGQRFLYGGDGRRTPCVECSYGGYPKGKTPMPTEREERPLFRMANPVTDVWLRAELHARFPDPDTIPGVGSRRIQVFDLIRDYQTRLMHGDRVTPVPREELVLRAMLRSYQDALLNAIMADNTTASLIALVVPLRTAVEILVESVVRAISTKVYKVAPPYQEDFLERLHGETAIDAPPKGLAWPPVGGEGGS